MILAGGLLMPIVRHSQRKTPPRVILSAAKNPALILVAAEVQSEIFLPRLRDQDDSEGLRMTA